MSRLVYLHLGPQPRAILRALDGETDAALAHRCLTKWPLAPVSHLTVEETPLTALLQPVAPLPLPTAPRPPGKPPKTPGQLAWKERKTKQALAERHRQHWIEKDAKKQAERTNPPAPRDAEGS